MKGQIKGHHTGNGFEFIRIDGNSLALITIDKSHHEIHEGDHYYIEGFTTLNITDTYKVKLVTPDSLKHCHFLWQIEANGILETHLYEAEGVTITGGSSVTPLNNNRNSSNASGMVITAGVTAGTPTGLDISKKKVGGTGFKSSSGGSSGREDEIILKSNTIYLRTFLSGSDDNIVSFKALWYEHISKY